MKRERRGEEEGADRHLPEDTDVQDCPAQWGSFGSLCHRVVLQTLVTKAGFTMRIVRRVTTTLSQVATFTRRSVTFDYPPARHPDCGG